MSKREPDPAIQATHGLGKADEPVREVRELPNNTEAEQALLGALLINNAALDRVVAFLEPEHFYEPLHQKIYGVVCAMIRSGKAVNPVLVKSFLPSDQKVGDMTVAHYLARLAAEAVTIINAREYGIAIHEFWLARQAISAAMDFLDFAFDPNAGVDVIGERTDLEDRLAQLRGMRVKSESRRGAGQQYIDNMNGVRQRGDVPGIPIALEEIQRVISEPTFELGNYYGLLSSSGEGKSSLTVQLVYHALAAGCAVQFQSFDQSAEQIVRQMVAQRYRIEARRQRFGDLKEGEWLEASLFAKWLDEQAFEVIECTHEGAPQLVGYARNFKRRRAGDKRLLIVTDHVNAVMPEKSTERADEGSKAAAINSILKAGAKSINAAWLVLNQRNTKGMQRDNPRPIASDLYGGEGAKRAYDAVFFLYRYKKFYAERCAIASKDSDWKIINKVFPSAVREGKDIADIGACKVRFGDPSIRETLDFNARFTLLESIVPAFDQDEMSFIKAMG